MATTKLPPLTKKAPKGNLVFICPRCVGHGATIDRGLINAFCTRCNGHGYLNEVDAKCDHKFGPGITIGRCLTLYVCKLCEHQREVDSSD